MTRHIHISGNAILQNWEAWLKGVVAAAIAGSANGIITGFAAVGIDPSHFNLQSGLHATLSIAMISAAMSGIIGVAAYLKQSPLPPSEDDGRDERGARDRGDDPDERVGHEDAVPDAIRHDAKPADISH
jgi:hypothetical protein